MFLPVFIDFALMLFSQMKGSLISVVAVSEVHREIQADGQLG